MFAVLGISAGFLWVADVTTDYHHDLDFSRYHTYSWSKVQTTNPLWQDRVIRAVDAQIANKLWTSSARV